MNNALSVDDIIEKLKKALTAGNAEEFTSLSELIAKDYPDSPAAARFFEIASEAVLKEGRAKMVDPKIFYLIAARAVAMLIEKSENPASWKKALEEYLSYNPKDAKCAYLLAVISILCGSSAEALSAVKFLSDDSPVKNVVCGMANFITGNSEESIRFFKKAVAVNKKVLQSDLEFIAGEGAFFFISLLISADQPEERIIRFAKNSMEKGRFPASTAMLYALMLYKSGEISEAKAFLSQTHAQEPFFPSFMADFAANYTVFTADLKKHREKFADRESKARQNGWHYLAMELEIAAEISKSHPSELLRILKEQSQKHGFYSFFTLLRYEEKWEKTLRTAIDLSLKAERDGIKRPSDGESEIVIKKSSGYYQLLFDPFYSDSASTPFDRFLQSLEELLLKKKVEIPEKGLPLLEKSITHLSKFMTIHTPFLRQREEKSVIESAKRLTLVLDINEKDELKCELFINPCNNKIAFLLPGRGESVIAADINGRNVDVARDLEAEKQNLDKFYALSPVLKQFEGRLSFKIDKEEKIAEVLAALSANSSLFEIIWRSSCRFEVTNISSSELALGVERYGSKGFKINGFAGSEQHAISAENSLRISNQQAAGL